MTESAEALTGGNATADVVRIGDTVRKPWRAGAPVVMRFMDAVRARGVDVPAHHGRDDAGRQVIEFVPGEMADSRVLTPDELRHAGRLVRAVHDASAGVALADEWDQPLLPAPHEDLVCHSDLTPWNLVMGERWVFIDWDGAGPSSRLWDLAYSAQAFAGMAAGERVADVAARLAAFLDGYGPNAEVCASLASTFAPRADAMHAMLRDAHRDGVEPWGAMYVSGHGDFWAGVAAYAAENEPVWARVCSAVS